MPTLFACLITIVPSVTVQSISHADDFGPTVESSIDIEKTMDKAREYIKAGELKKATKQLDKVVDQDKSHADAWNLLGYSWRKLDNNRKSKKAYARALKIDPNHKGALEYQGELFIKLGDRDSARKNLAQLKALCPTGCEELTNLTQALAGKSSY